jgi:hypothetical protein
MKYCVTDLLRNVTFISYMQSFIQHSSLKGGACGSIEVKALCYKLESREFDTR